MPRLADVAKVLAEYRGRYECLDAFVDDIEELADGSVSAFEIPGRAQPTFRVWADGQWLQLELFPEPGVARFRFLAPGSTPSPATGIGLGAAIGGLLGTAAGAASETKENLLGGLVLGVLVGGLLGGAVSATTAPATVERALTMRFDPTSSSWELYDGPYLRWAKQTLIPPPNP